jgi:hypothetical protein
MPGDCSWPRSGRLARFFEFYSEVTLAYVPELHPGCQPALRGHDDVLDIIETLKTNAEKPRAQLTKDYSRREIRMAVLLFPRLLIKIGLSISPSRS